MYGVLAVILHAFPTVVLFLGQLDFCLHFLKHVRNRKIQDRGASKSQPKTILLSAELINPIIY